MASSARFALMVMMGMLVLFFMQMACMVTVRAAMVAPIGVVMQNGEDEEVANESKDACDEHIDWLLDFVLFYHPMGSFNE